MLNGGQDVSSVPPNIDGSFVAGMQEMSGSMNGYKNPWTSVSRPMNGFIDIRED